MALVMHKAATSAICNVHLNYFNIDFEQHDSSDHFWFLHVATQA